MTRWVAASLSLLMGLGWCGSAAAAGPRALLDNGVLQVTVELPGAPDSYYRGDRFDWSGVISSLKYAGHDYYPVWWTKYDPKVEDYIFTDQGPIAGKDSGVTGPVEEFMDTAGLPLGYAAARPGGTFVKIGVGILSKPDDKPYSHYRDYEIVDRKPWKVQATRTSISFTQRVLDPRSGYGYLYTKVLRLIPGQPRMVIEHTLKNIGRLPIETTVYDHNFLSLDHQTTGPDFSVVMPYAITPDKPDRPTQPELGTVEGNRIVLHRPPKEKEIFRVYVRGSETAKENDIRMEYAKAGAGVEITGDHPLYRAQLCRGGDYRRSSALPGAAMVDS
jgi:hypothetical protein